MAKLVHVSLKASTVANKFPIKTKRKLFLSSGRFSCVCLLPVYAVVLIQFIEINFNHMDDQTESWSVLNLWSIDDNWCSPYLRVKEFAIIAVNSQSLAHLVGHVRKFYLIFYHEVDNLSSVGYWCSCFSIASIFNHAIGHISSS